MWIIYCLGTICPPQISHGLFLDVIRTSAMINRRLIAGAVAWAPFSFTLDRITITVALDMFDVELICLRPLMKHGSKNHSLNVSSEKR